MDVLLELVEKGQLRLGFFIYMNFHISPAHPAPPVNSKKNMAAKHTLRPHGTGSGGRTHTDFSTGT